MLDERCLKDATLECKKTCPLRAVAAKVARRAPVDPDILPKEYEAWGHVVMQDLGTVDAVKVIGRRCVRP